MMCSVCGDTGVLVVIEQWLACPRLRCQLAARRRRSSGASGDRRASPRASVNLSTSRASIACIASRRGVRSMCASDRPMRDWRIAG